MRWHNEMIIMWEHPMISSAVVTQCHHFTLSLHIIIPCYNSVLLSYVIMPCYDSMLSFSVIILCYHPVLLHHVIIARSQPMLLSNVIIPDDNRFQFCYSSILQSSVLRWRSHKKLHNFSYWNRSSIVICEFWIESHTVQKANFGIRALTTYFFLLGAGTA
jgi:hypothetical protein